MKKVLLHIFATFVLLSAEAVNREDRKIEVDAATANIFKEKEQSFTTTRYSNTATKIQNEKTSNLSSNLSSDKINNVLNSSFNNINEDSHPNFSFHLPYEYARSSNSSFSFRKGRSKDSNEPVNEEEEEMESLDNLFPEALRQSDDSFGDSDSEQDYLTFSSIGDAYHDNSTYEEYDSVESLDDLEPSALIGENYDVEEVIENLDDLTAGALIANYLFEEDVDHPEKLPNASRLLKRQLYDLDHLLDGTGVNATVLLSAVDTLKNAGGLQNLLKATKGAHGFMSRLSPTSGMTPLSPAGVNSLGQVGGAMKHKDMDEIRRELKTMLFSSENKMPVPPAYSQRPPNNLPRYSSSAPQRLGQPQDRPQNPGGPPQNANPYQQRKYQVVSSTGNRRNYPPAPPPVPPKNFHFGGYVKIHLPSIYQQIKGQKRKSDKGKGYQRPGYFQRNPITRNFKPSDRLDPKKDAFRPLPPPSRGVHSVYDANRRYMPANMPQRPPSGPNSPPYKSYDTGPIRTKENVGSQSEQRLSIETQRCDTFWENVCLEADVYPKDTIRYTFAKYKMTADILLADVKQQSADSLVEGVSQEEEQKYSYSHYYGTRRQGEDAHLHRDFANDGGYICPSDIIYGKPKRARNSKGIWKYIINFDNYTQTLRMEKCMKPGGSCSYLSPHFESQCSQLYNYQRLLSWDETKGLHIDIYKVPSGCSCHIKGYSKYQERINTSRGKKRKISKYRTKTGNRDDITDNYGNFSNMDSVVTNGSPKQYPEKRGEEMEYGKPRQRNKAYTSPSGRIGNVQESESGRKNNEKSKVNYGYHPIIDFFQNYRFTAAR